MKIVHVLTRFLKAGSEENTLLTCEGQLQAGHEVHLVYGREVDLVFLGKVDPRIKVHQIAEMVHPVRPWNDFFAVRRMSALFRAIDADVVHTHQSKAGIIGRLAARLARVPHVIHGVHIVSFDNAGRLGRFVYVFVERIAARWTDLFINVSEGVKRSYLSNGIGIPERHRVVYSGMDVSRFNSAVPPADWPKMLGLADGAPAPFVILMLAAYEPRKRHAELLHAFKEVAAADSRPHLVLAGSGAGRSVIQALVFELGLVGRVSVLGFYPRPEELVAMADVCLLTSLREGLPRVVVQYLAGGKPVVVSHVEGIEEIIDDGVNGLITPTEDVASAARALLQLAQDSTLCQQLTVGARIADVQRWDRSKMHVDMRRAYASIGAVGNA